MQVDKQKFDALMAKLITTPASAKDSIKKPKPTKARPKPGSRERLSRAWYAEAASSDLTPEERQRIYLGKKARLETRQKIEGEKTGTGKVLGIIALSTFGALAVLMIAVPALEHSDPPAAPGSSAERTLSLDWQCIPGSEDAAVQFNLAMAHKDLAAGGGARHAGWSVILGCRN